MIRFKARLISVDLVRHKGLDGDLSDLIDENPGQVETLALSLVRDFAV